MSPGADDRLNGPCIWGLPTGPCGATPTHPYKGGAFCDPHSPWARNGHPKLGSPAKTDNETRSLQDGDQQNTPLPGAAA